MNAVTQARKARAAMKQRESLYETRYRPNPDGSVDWSLYLKGTSWILVGGNCVRQSSAAKEAANALRVRVEYPEHYKHELME